MFGTGLQPQLSFALYTSLSRMHLLATSRSPANREHPAISASVFSVNTYHALHNPDNDLSDHKDINAQPFNRSSAIVFHVSTWEACQPHSLYIGAISDSMAELAAILPIVSRSSSLALELYRVAASTQDVARNYIKAAKSINAFASIVKQVGTIIKEDDRLPSHEAHETLENVIQQSGSIFTEIASITSIRNDANKGSRPVRDGQLRQEPMVWTRLEYLTAHLEALRATLSVLLQTLYTAQSIMWSKLRPTVSPQQAARAVANEKMQLETLIIEQQLSILLASKLYEQTSRPEARMLMETDSSQSLTASGRGSTTPNPTQLHRYHDTYLASIDTSGPAEGRYLSATCSISGPQVEILLEKWTSLPQFDDRLRDAEREIRMQQRESQQPTVESDSEEENNHRKSRRSQRSGSVQPLFSDMVTAPISVPGSKSGLAVPPSPASSPKTRHNNLTAPTNEQYAPVSPRSSLTSLPVEAAAAIEANEEDSDVDLEIPWTLCTRKYYWKYIDSKVISSNTDMSPSTAFSERHPWTEIMASWVCKEAIREAGYKVTQVQKERREGKRTKLETCFCIEHALRFEHVKQLVERTVELYRSKQLSTSPPQKTKTKRSSLERERPPPPIPQRTNEIDRDRTPRPHAPLERSTSTLPYSSLPPPPPLDRSLSTPGPGSISSPRPYPNDPNANHYLPPPYPPPHHNITQSQSHLSTPAVPHQFPYPLPYPPPLHRQTHPPYPNQNQNANSIPKSPLRQSYMNFPSNKNNNSNSNNNNNNSPTNRYDNRYDNRYENRNDNRYDTRYDNRYDTDFTTSESDSGDRDRERARRYRSKSRTRGGHTPGRKKRTMQALMGVGGLTALLDGLGGL